MNLRPEKEHAAELAEQLGITEEMKILKIESYLLHYGHEKWKEGANEIAEIGMKAISQK